PACRDWRTRPPARTRAPPVPRPVGKRGGLTETDAQSYQAIIPRRRRRDRTKCDCRPAAPKAEPTVGPRRHRKAPGRPGALAAALLADDRVDVERPNYQVTSSM